MQKACSDLVARSSAPQVPDLLEKSMTYVILLAVAAVMIGLSLIRP